MKKNNMYILSIDMYCTCKAGKIAKRRYTTMYVWIDTHYALAED